MDPALLSSQNHTWQTPENVLALVRQLGPIALDPCTVPENPVEASHCIAPPGDGLRAHWSAIPGPGLVYCNPPYGRALRAWIDKCALEGAAQVEIVLLVPARPDTRWYDRAVTSANAHCEWRGRLTFKGAKDPAPFPSALFYWGPKPWLFCHLFAPHGRVRCMRGN